MKLPIVAALAAAAATIAVVRGVHPAPAASFVTGSPAQPAAIAALVRRPVAPEKIVVYVAGAVRKSGLYTLAVPARANDALRAAGGATRGADLAGVNLAAPLEDGDQVTVPTVDGDSSAATSTPRSGHHRKHRRRHHKRKHRRPKPVATAGVSGVDLNTADAAELETLPGVGATLAGRIVAFRELTGPFASTDDLLDVAGVTSSKLEAIAPFVRAVPPGNGETAP